MEKWCTPAQAEGDAETEGENDPSIILAAPAGVRVEPARAHVRGREETRARGGAHREVAGRTRRR